MFIIKNLKKKKFKGLCYSFNFYNSRLFLKHQILSAEYRTVNFFDKFIFSFFLDKDTYQGSLIDFNKKRRLSTKQLPLYFYFTFRGHISSKTQEFKLKKRKLPLNFKENIMSKSFSFTDINHVVFNVKKSVKPQNVLFSHLNNRKFDFFEFFREFWL